MPSSGGRCASNLRSNSANICLRVSFKEFISMIRFFLGTLRRYHSQTLSVRNDKRHMPIYNDTKLMFIQDINNLSGGFMPSQGAFLWADKLYLELTEKTQVRFRLNASTFYLKRNYVLLQTQGRSIQNARAFSEAFRRDGKREILTGCRGWQAFL